MKLWDLQTDKPQALMLTAHPDDETIFGGGLLLTYRKWDWLLICITMETQERADEFTMAINAYRHTGVSVIRSQSFHMPDRGKSLTVEEYERWLDALNQLNLHPDIVFTHNGQGEYGHPHHKATNKIAHKLYDNVWDFWCPGEHGGPVQRKKKQTQEVLLTHEILTTKQAIFDKAYLKQKAGLLQGLPNIMRYELNVGPEIYTK
jgi:LmbE family N-acetylglucosaminyl deacetylase